jgi:hypothetical protein
MNSSSLIADYTAKIVLLTKEQKNLSQKNDSGTHQKTNKKVDPGIILFSSIIADKR